MSNASPEEIAWAAGLFEGEGSFFASHPSGKKGIQLNTRVNMTDLDVLEQFRDIMPVGRLSSWPSQSPSHKGNKPLYTWYTTSVSDFVVVYLTLLPWLHKRRREKAQSIMREWLDIQNSLDGRWTSSERRAQVNGALDQG